METKVRTLRTPEELDKRIEWQAKRHGVSVNAYINMRMAQVVDYEEQKEGEMKIDNSDEKRS